MTAKSVMLGFALIFLAIVIGSGVATFAVPPDGLIPPGPELYYGEAYFVSLIVLLFIPLLMELSKRHG